MSDYDDVILEQGIAAGASWLQANRGLILPYGRIPGNKPGGREIFKTKQEWDDYQWNPPEFLPFLSKPDPQASPKPTWATMVDATRRAGIQSSAEQAQSRLAEEDSAREELTDRNVLTVGGGDIHVGDGLDHMTGLLQMVEQANIAGDLIPHIVLRDSNNKSKSIHTQEQIRQVLEVVAERENRVESAHNTVMQGYQEIASIRDDESKTLDDREKAAKQAREYARMYRKHLEAAIKAYDPDALPTDLPILKQVLQERLEANALARTKEIKGVLTQQGVDLPQSCLDEGEALEKVSMQQRLGAMNIRMAATTEAATNAYDSAVEEIGKASPLNTPVWVNENGAPVTNFEFTGNTTLIARHPRLSRSRTIPGPVEVGAVVVQAQQGSDVGFKFKFDGADFKQTEVILKAGSSGTAKWKLSSRSVCGPSPDIEVSIKAA